MNKTITTALLILVSGLTLSTTALAELYNHGGSHVNAISNAYSSTHVQSVQSVRNPTTMATLSGFNDRGTVENEDVTVSSRIGLEMPNSRMLSITTGGFNDRS
jgi:hypothetical protein